jgi:spectinomycin phosphotransferase
VRTRPSDLNDEAVTRSISDGWHVQVASMSYVPEGGGSHHWKVKDARGEAFFVRVDDLDDKDWLGDGRNAVFDGLARALATAGALRRDAELPFVVAPLLAADGALARRLNPRYAISVYPYLDGVSYPFGPYTDARVRAAALEMVIAVHGATPVVVHLAPRHEPKIGRRDDLDAFLREPDRPWSTGPFADPAHELLAARAAAIAYVVRGFDRLVDATAGARLAAAVVTHGEPHPANVMSVSDHLALIDWDTVALAPPERDLWLLTADGDDPLSRYQAVTGRHVDAATMTLYRLRWYLDDIASAVRLFRAPHERTADTQRWWDGLAPRVEAMDSWRHILA